MKKLMQAGKQPFDAKTWLPKISKNESRRWIEYGSDYADYAPSGVWIALDDGNNKRAVKIIRTDGSGTIRTFDDPRLADTLIQRALEIQRVNAPLSDF